MGFECLEKSSGVYRVFTPLSFSDGEPISLYYIEERGMVRISDNADTLFHLRSIGMDVSDRKKWKGVGQIISTFGMKLEHSGEVTGIAVANGAAGLVSRYIGAMLAIADLEREVFGVGPEMTDFIDEVEGHLKLWRPNEELIRNCHAVGHSGRSHDFNFRMSDELIDAARPHSGKTGAILRKAADVQNSSLRVSIMVVMDDRFDPERARAESDILSTLVKVLPFSRLTNNLSGAPPVTH
nr:DUF1828 domain-containing protein [Stenotrophobium rhamnosiphilum]